MREYVVTKDRILRHLSWWLHLPIYDLEDHKVVSAQEVGAICTLCRNHFGKTVEVKGTTGLTIGEIVRQLTQAA